MTAIQSDLDGFHNFASEELARSGRDLTLEDLLRQWRARQEQAETLASIRRGIADSEAGRVQGLTAVDDSIRVELGFPARRR